MADQAVTRSSGSARYGYHSAAATTDVVSSGRSRASTSTRYPAWASRTAQLSPVTPAPTNDSGWHPAHPPPWRGGVG